MTDTDKAHGPERWIRYWAAIVVVLLVALGGTTIAYLHASAAAEKATTASHEASAAVACVNRILGERAQLTRQDALAHIDFARVLKSYNEAFAVLIVDIAKKKPESQTKADFLVVVRDAPLLAVATQRYDAILAADQAARDAHPFSKCS